jgi:hypothetical protein
LKLGQVDGFEIPSFVKSNNNTKDHVLSMFDKDPELLQYLPDDIQITSIQKNFLMSVRYSLF